MGTHTATTRDNDSQWAVNTNVDLSCTAARTVRNSIGSPVISLTVHSSPASPLIISSRSASGSYSNAHLMSNKVSFYQCLNSHSRSSKSLISSPFIPNMKSQSQLSWARRWWLKEVDLFSLDWVTRSAHF